MTQGEGRTAHIPVVILPLLVNISGLVGIEMSNVNFLIVENLVKLMLELFVLSLNIFTVKPALLCSFFRFDKLPFVVGEAHPMQKSSYSL